MLNENILWLYDREVERHPEGIKFADASSAIYDEVRELVEAEPRDIERETRLAMQAAISGERDRRSKALARDLDYFLDYLQNPEEGALIPDDRLHSAFRLGTNDGADKTLMFWRVEDFVFWAQVRMQGAREAMTSAEITVDIAERIVAKMKSSNVRFFGDIDWSSVGAA